MNPSFLTHRAGFPWGVFSAVPRGPRCLPWEPLPHSPTDAFWGHLLDKHRAVRSLSQALLLGELHLRHTAVKTVGVTDDQVRAEVSYLHVITA